MNVQSAAIGAALSDLARRNQAQAAAKRADQARKAEVAKDAGLARQSPRFDAQETRKQQAKAKLQQIREWLKIVRKLYAQDPRGMAKALTQVFKDLKAAVQAYKDAGGEEMGMAGDAVGAVLSPPQADGGKPDQAAVDEAGEKPEAADPSSDPGDQATRSSSDGASLYGAVVDETRKRIGEDGLDFLKEVRGMVGDLKDLLQTARGQAAARKRDKDTDKAFDDVDKSLKDLDEAMDDMDRQIRRDAPTAGMKLSMAA